MLESHARHQYIQQLWAVVLSGGTTWSADTGYKHPLIVHIHIDPEKLHEFLSCKWMFDLILNHNLNSQQYYAVKY